MPDCVAAVAAREWGPWGAGVGRGWARRASRTGGSWDARHVRTAASRANGRPFQLSLTQASLRRYDAATWRASASAPVTEAGTCVAVGHFPNRAHGWGATRRGGAAVARWYGAIAVGAYALAASGSAFVCTVDGRRRGRSAAARLWARVVLAATYAVCLADAVPNRRSTTSVAASFCIGNRFLGRRCAPAGRAGGGWRASQQPALPCWCCCW